MKTYRYRGVVIRKTLFGDYQIPSAQCTFLTLAAAKKFIDRLAEEAL